MAEWTKEDEDFFLHGHWDDYAPPEECPIKRKPKRFNAFIQGTTKAPKYKSALTEYMLTLCTTGIIIIVIVFLIS